MNDLFGAPSAGFDHPLEMLVACHVRVRRNCELIERIARHLEDKGLDDEVMAAAGSVLRYFDVAGRDHHRDEEEDLFPALLVAASGDGRAGAEALVARLRADHANLERQWEEIRLRLAELHGGRACVLEPALASELSCAYADHIAEEESVLLPLARRLLSAGTLERIGTAMARRRGSTR